MSEQASRQLSGQASGRAGGARRASEGSGSNSSFLFIIIQTFTIFFLRAIAPFTGKMLAKCYISFVCDVNYVFTMYQYFFFFVPHSPLFHTLEYFRLKLEIKSNKFYTFLVAYMPLCQLVGWSVGQ